MRPPSGRSIALGLVVLGALTIVAVGVAGIRASSATFSTVSTTSVRGRADMSSDWLRLYSEYSDPDGLTAYAPRRLSSPQVPAAEGQDEGLTVDLGGYPDAKQDFILTRVFTLETPDAFVDTAVTQVTVTATLVADPGGMQPLRKVTITGPNGAGNLATVSLGPGQKRQLNVTVRSKRNFEVGTTYYPHVVLVVRFAGAPADYYVYDIPMSFTDAGV